MIIGRVAMAVLLSTALAGCGLRPLYGGTAGSGIESALGRIDVAPIPGRAGWLMSGALRERLGDSGDAAYRVEVTLDDDITGFGIRRDDAVTRERRTLRARYRLVDAAQGTVLLDATAGSDAGIDVVGSGYATYAAEQTALERLSEIVADEIVARVALFVRRTSPPAR